MQKDSKLDQHIVKYFEDNIDNWTYIIEDPFDKTYNPARTVKNSGH